MTAATAPMPAAGLLSISTRLVWTAAMIEALLQVRVGQMGRQFARNNSKQQLSVLWSKVTIGVNLCIGMNLSVAQVKSKYNALRHEYVAISAQQQETGNDTETPIAFPPYWESLVAHFGDKNGLGDIEYAPSDVSCQSSGNDTEADEPISEDMAQDKEKGKRAGADVVDTMQHKKRRVSTSKRKDLGGSLVRMGELIAAGMVEAAQQAKESRQQQESIEHIESLIAKNMEESARVNHALLSFLKDHEAK